MSMILLLLAAALWIGWHVGLAGTSLRGRVVEKIGEMGFMIGFSIGSVASIILLVMAWQAAPMWYLWTAPRELRWVLALVMLPAFIFFIASVTQPNPTSAGQKLGEAGPRGMTRITRHPMLWSFAIWAAVHMLGNGDMASLVFFGAFLVTCVLGMPSIDAKLARRDPAMWARLAPSTSILPFGAVLSGRGRVNWAEIGPRPLVFGSVLWVGLLVAHPIAFGVPAVYF
jgi:uncharacterized membrane protein